MAAAATARLPRPATLAALHRLRIRRLLSAVESAFDAFLEDSLILNGISYVAVDAAGTLHTAAFGGHTEDTIVMLASTSKVPAVMPLLALEEDPNVAFDLNQPIREVLPFDGV